LFLTPFLHRMFFIVTHTWTHFFPGVWHGRGLLVIPLPHLFRLDTASAASPQAPRQSCLYSLFFLSWPCDLCPSSDPDLLSLWFARSFFPHSPAFLPFCPGLDPPPQPLHCFLFWWGYDLFFCHEGHLSIPPSLFPPFFTLKRRPRFCLIDLGSSPPLVVFPLIAVFGCPKRGQPPVSGIFSILPCLSSTPPPGILPHFHG